MLDRRVALPATQPASAGKESSEKRLGVQVHLRASIPAKPGLGNTGVGNAVEKQSFVSCGTDIERKMLNCPSASSHA